MSRLFSSLRNTQTSAPLGIGFMLLGILLFSANDAMGKWLVWHYSVGMVLLIRSIAGLLILQPFFWRDGGFTALRSVPHPRLQLLRVVLATVEVGFFYWAVGYMPLADVMTYYLAGPIYVAAMSLLFLKEKIDRGRWVAILIGFVGVLFLLNPSAASLSWPALIALAGSLIYSGVLVTTRQLRGTRDSSMLVFSMSGSLLAGIILAPWSWVTPTPIDLAGLALLGLIGLGGSFCINRSLKLAAASVVVPYQYTMIIWAVVFGYLFFGDKPHWNVLVGAAIIIGSGLVIFLREQRRDRNGSSENVGEIIAEEVGSSAPTQP